MIAFTINPNGADTTYVVKYSLDPLDPSLGTSTTPVDIGAGSTAQNATATLTGLTPGSTYQYEVVATNAAGSTSSSVQPLITDPQIAGTAGQVTNLSSGGQRRRLPDRRDDRLGRRRLGLCHAELCPDRHEQRLGHRRRGAHVRPGRHVPDPGSPTSERTAAPPPNTPVIAPPGRGPGHDDDEHAGRRRGRDDAQHDGDRRGHDHLDLDVDLDLRRARRRPDRPRFRRRWSSRRQTSRP